MLAPSQPANVTVTTCIINKRWRHVNPPTQQSRHLLINVGTSRPANATVATSINKRLCQHTVNKSTIQSTRAGLGRCHLAFAVANCVLNRRFAMATVGSCSDCWKLRRVAGEACNMMENALSIFIFSVQLQQTEISDKKLFIFQHGTPLVPWFDH